MIREIYIDAGKNAPRVGGLLIGDDVSLQLPFEATDELTQFIRELETVFKEFQPNVNTARLFAPAELLAPGSQANWEKRYLNVLKQYDFVTLMARPSNGVESDSQGWLEALVDQLAKIPTALNRTAFLLPTMDKRSRHSTTSGHLAAQLGLLQLGGARNFGYYPDRVLEDYPAADVIRPVISLKTNPGRQS
jgi:biofilm PGA synthesis lipoprotein PgaB